MCSPRAPDCSGTGTQHWHAVLASGTGIRHWHLHWHPVLALAVALAQMIILDKVLYSAMYCKS